MNSLNEQVRMAVSVAVFTFSKWSKKINQYGRNGMPILSLHTNLTWNVIPLCIHPVSPIGAMSNQHVQVRNRDAGMWSFLIRLILSYVYKTLCIYHIFTFRNYGRFQTSNKCVKSQRFHSEQMQQIWFGDFTPPTAAKGEKASTAEDFVRDVCMLILGLVLPKYQAILI